MYNQALLIALLSLGAISSAAAELQPSNGTERTQCTFQDHTNATVEYGSMRMNGRRIFGGLVPYGRLWDTGYNRSTTFVASSNLMVGGKEIPAGHYSLLTIPGPDKWTMVLKKMANKDSPDRMDEVAGIDLLIRRLPQPLESFAIWFEQYRSGCVLNLRWEQTEASVLVAEKK